MIIVPYESDPDLAYMLRTEVVGFQSWFDFHHIVFDVEYCRVLT